MKMRDKVAHVIASPGATFKYGHTVFFRCDDLDALRFHVDNIPNYTSASVIASWDENALNIGALMQRIYYNRRFFRVGFEVYTKKESV